MGFWQAVQHWVASTTSLFEALGPWGLALLSFAEASFFPVPPDLVLIPLALSQPSLALWYGTLATAFSTLGGLFGYWLGRKVGRRILERLASESQIRQIEGLFRRYGGWAVLAAALTPIPYKLFTIAAGLFVIPLGTFAWASVIGRGLRFYLEALLLWLYGPSVVQFLQGPFGWLTVVVTIALAFVYWVAHRYGWTRRLLDRTQGLYRQVLRRQARIWEPLGEFGTALAAGLVLDSFFLVLFAKLVDDLREKELAALDHTLTAAARAASGPGVTEAMRLISLLGSPATVVLLGLFLGLWLWRTRRLPWAAWMLEVNLIGAWLLNELLKVMFRRPRPEVLRLAAASGYSFPSGHSMVSFALYGFLAFLLWRLSRRDNPGVSRRSLVIASFVAGILVFLVGWSRVYLGVHYPSDVLAGFAAGGLWATSCAVLYLARS